MKERSYAKAFSTRSEGIPTIVAARVRHHRVSALKDALAVMVASELISCLPSFVPHFSRRDESLIRPRG